jgi:hypothetical protein
MGAAFTTSAQVNAFCGDIKTANALKITSTKRRYLQELADAQRDDKPSRTRAQRHRMISAQEIGEKYQAETGFNLLGAMAEPAQEQWERPQAQTLYWKLCVRSPGKPSVADYEGADLHHLAWMAEAELVDIDGEGTIWLLSDCEDTSRRYPGAKVLDERAKKGRTWTADEVDAMVAYAFEQLEAGTPLVPLSADQVREMDCKAGIRFSSHEAARQVNAGILAPDRDARCQCRGRAGVEHAWELLDHDNPDCPCRHRWIHVESARRSIARLKEADGPLNRTQNTYVTRRNHSEYRVAAAYEIAPDAGWHAYAEETRKMPKAPRKVPARALSKARRQLEKAA